MILGIDVGSRSGWALARYDGGTVEIVEYGHLVLGRKRGVVANLDRIRELLVSFDEPNPLDKTAAWIEGVGFASFRDAHASYWRIRTLWEVALGEHGWDALGVVPTGTLKKHATGKGNADKTEMVRAARESYRVPLWSTTESEGQGKRVHEDIADACHVAAYGARMASE